MNESNGDEMVGVSLGRGDLIAGHSGVREEIKNGLVSYEMGVKVQIRMSQRP